MYHNLLEGQPKSDIVFYKAFIQDKGNKRSFAGLKTLLLGFMVTLIVNYQASTSNSDVFQAQIINAVVSLIGIILPVLQLRAIYSSPQVFLKLADSNMHIVPEQLTTNVSTIKDCVSQTIFIGIGNLRESDLNQPTKKAYIAATLKGLSLQLSSKYRGYASLTRFNSILSMVTLINSIIILIQQPNLDSLNKGFFITYIVLVGLSELLIVLLVLLAAFIPVICCVLCFYVCCCRVSKGEGINLPVKKANMQDILNCDGTCSICYQNIGQNEDIYVLLCSSKHVFHKNCLGHWSKVKNNCPICRAEIPMGGSGSENLVNDQ